MNINQIKKSNLYCWRKNNILSKLIKAFRDKAEIRFVGGCVRNSFLGLQIGDIDFAVNCKPDSTIKILVENKIDYFDYGLDYGTVTATINKKNYEITSLRKDIKTNGRFTKVEYSNSWEQDALRRDFTINAIYLTTDGNLFDPCNGIQDLESNKIAFIGDANKRIQEDYLRILRFYRFLGIFKNPNYDPKEFYLIDKNFIKMKNYVSNNKIKKELLKMITNAFCINSFLLKPDNTDLNKKNLIEKLENLWLKDNYLEGLNILKRCKKIIDGEN